jgi:AcrR family transcriptional regulator
MTHFQRARSDDAKQSRELSILDAARRLATRDGVRAVTLTAIAEAVGMHKSGLLRYFETREQIFLRLAAQEVGDEVASSLTSRPLFCDLLAHVSLSLERNVSVESVRAFKSVTHEQVDLIGAALVHAFPLLSVRDSVDIIATAVSTAGTMWQMSTPGEVLADVYRSDSRLAHAIVDFEPTLARIMTALITGLLAEHDSHRTA